MHWYDRKATNKNFNVPQSPLATSRRSLRLASKENTHIAAQSCVAFET